MKEIWAPWRVEYFTKKQKGCFLCKAFRSRKDRENHVLKRGKTCAIIINRYPYTGGHLMVAPYRHVASLEHMNPREHAEMMKLTIEATAALRKSIHPHGFNIGINIGAAAGAGLKDHVHMHIVPRWTGDTNFITVMADVRIVPQSLLDLWDQLRKVIKR
ncbi:MAG: HIT domain-containing protein [Verrucomicrobiota bacterium]